MDKKICATCIRGISFSFSSDILCKKKGIVDPYYCCFAYKPNPDITEKKYNCINCENFSPGLNPSIGNCRILTVRVFDGSLRNACSRFIHKIS